MMINVAIVKMYSPYQRGGITNVVMSKEGPVKVINTSFKRLVQSSLIKLILQTRKIKVTVNILQHTY